MSWQGRTGRESSFRGRNDDLARLLAWLEHPGLITLTGPPGVGKSRLSAEAAAAAARLGYIPTIVDLSPAAFSDPPIPRIAAALDHPNPGMIRTEEALARIIGDNAILIVLDDCEHEVSTCVRIAACLSARCPNARLIATSPVALKTDGERVHRVAPLAWPKRQSTQASGLTVQQTARQYPAVQLFLDRAQAADPSFDPELQDVTHIIEVCRHVDGLPLGIELLAALTCALPLSELPGYLAKYPNLPPATPGTGHRHHSLATCIQAAADLLPERAAVLLRRLAVFVGGWTLSAAEHVCCFSGLLPDSVAASMDVLAQHSLIEISPGHPPRHRFLNAVRQHAEAALVWADELDAARTRHAVFFAERVEWADSLDPTRERELALRESGLDYDNAVAALLHSARDSAASSGRALTIAGALGWYWEARALTAEGLRLLEIVLTDPTGPQVSHERAKAWLVKGNLEKKAGKWPIAAEAYSRALSDYDELANAEGVARAKHNLANCALVLGRLDEAARLFHEALRLNALTRPVLAARNLDGLARVHYMKGGIEGYGHAVDLQGEAITEARRADDKPNVITEMEVNRGIFAVAARQFDVARSCFASAIRSAQQHDWPEVTCASLEGISEVLRTEGKSVPATQLAAKASGLRVELKLPRAPSDEVSFQTHLDQLRAAFSEPEFLAAWGKGQVMTIEESLQVALAGN
ncbi:MAG: hypothetical protein IT436_15975 [Phycisphaerales bacterium]|nr:hypothetical protein [Phycisphaerales bacterium]